MSSSFNTPRRSPTSASGSGEKSSNRNKRGGGGGFLLFLLLVAGIVCFALFYYDESPQQLWRRLVDTVEKRLHPPVPPPVPAASPTPAPATTATPAPTAVPTATPVPTPSRDPLAWLLEHKERWPREVVLLREVEFPVVFDGKVAGSAKVPAGKAVRLVEITAAEVAVVYGGGGTRVPITLTDLHQRAEAAMNKADADAAAALAKANLEAKATALATPIPSASPEPDPGETEDILADEQPSKTGAFVHPGLLHNEEDFKRMRMHKGREPWKSGWERLMANRHSQLDYKPNPLEIVVRGQDRLHTDRQNYMAMCQDAAAAYQTALRWRVSGDRRYAEKSIEILNAWGSTLKEIAGSTDNCLARGFQGYQFANAAEIMRTYKGWKPEDFARFKKMMLEVFAAGNEGFLEHHNGTRDNHYWANWDLCNLASLMAIGVLCDDRGLYNKAIRYAKHGKGMGAIKNAIYYVHPGGLGQWQESGRDQGHTTLGIPLMAVICEQAWKQGDDLYGYDNNRFLAGCEYVAKYNLGEDVPYKPYTNDKGTSTEISPGGRGMVRPGWELVYNHYVKLKGLPATYMTKMAEKARPEGGGEGAVSGGYDQLGFGTLTATIDPHEASASSQGKDETPSFWKTEHPAAFGDPSSSPAP